MPEMTSETDWAHVVWMGSGRPRSLLALASPSEPLLLGALR